MLPLLLLLLLLLLLISVLNGNEAVWARQSGPATTLEESFCWRRRSGVGRKNSALARSAAAAAEDKGEKITQTHYTTTHNTDPLTRLNDCSLVRESRLHWCGRVRVRVVGWVIRWNHLLTRFCILFLTKTQEWFMFLRYVRQVGLCTGFPWSRKKSQIFNFKLKSLKYVHILHIEWKLKN